ncbi:MAG: hypothetical protein KUG64_03995 [Cycloclasticus sp.]|nr:hypothetical protein [Cycloclasticus sp.]
MTISRIRISFFIIPLLFSQGILAHEKVKKMPTTTSHQPYKHPTTSARFGRTIVSNDYQTHDHKLIRTSRRQPINRLNTTHPVIFVTPDLSKYYRQKPHLYVHLRL